MTPISENNPFQPHDRVCLAFLFLVAASLFPYSCLGEPLAVPVLFDDSALQTVQAGGLVDQTHVHRMRILLDPEDSKRAEVELAILNEAGVVEGYKPCPRKIFDPVIYGPWVEKLHALLIERAEVAVPDLDQERIHWIGIPLHSESPELEMARQFAETVDVFAVRIHRYLQPGQNGEAPQVMLSMRLGVIDLFNWIDPRSDERIARVVRIDGLPVSETPLWIDQMRTLEEAGTPVNWVTRIRGNSIQDTLVLPIRMLEHVAGVGPLYALETDFREAAMRLFQKGETSVQVSVRRVIPYTCGVAEPPTYERLVMNHHVLLRNTDPDRFVPTVNDDGSLTEVIEAQRGLMRAFDRHSPSSQLITLTRAGVVASACPAFLERLAETGN